jgi:acetoin utilization protein AcuB
MKIKQIMNTKVACIEMDETLVRIQELFNHVSFHHLLVTEYSKLSGVISDRDLLKAISPYAGTASELPRDAATMNKRAHQIMSRKPVTIRANSSVSSAIDLLLKKGISCLPVVDKDNKIEGIVTWKDLIKANQPQHK